MKREADAVRFHLNITLTEEDYLTFNIFHAMETTAGKKTIRNSRILLISVMAVSIVLLVLILGWTMLSGICVTLLGLLAVLYTIFGKRIIKHNIKEQISRLKKTGTLPFDTVAELAFYDDKIVEITANKRTELSYDALERICVVGNRYLYLYNSSVTAYIIPIPQLAGQLDEGAFWNFISQKCKSVELHSS